MLDDNRESHADALCKGNPEEGVSGHWRREGIGKINALRNFVTLL